MTTTKPAPRRVRYKGRYPSKPEEKYKELNPEKYNNAVEQIREKGRTPLGTHVPIMLTEILARLSPRRGERGLDATLGYGGHAEALISKIGAEGFFVGIDADGEQLPKTGARLRALYETHALEFQNLNYSEISEWLKKSGGKKFDFVLADLGLSSMQIDNPARGFSHKFEGPLDLRMDTSSGLAASKILSRITAEELANLLIQNGDEPNARVIARHVLASGERTPLVTTQALVLVLKEAVRKLPRTAIERDEKKTIQRFFQALRIHVNDEFRHLEKFLETLPDVLAPGGRVAILTFHSGEDRRVKKSFENLFKKGVYSDISETVIRATPEEVFKNVRSKPAKLRWAIRK